jgi:hypothetical protein
VPPPIPGLSPIPSKPFPTFPSDSVRCANHNLYFHSPHSTDYYLDTLETSCVGTAPSAVRAAKLRHCLHPLPLQYPRDRSLHPRSACGNRNHTRPPPLHPPPTNRAAHHHHWGILVHPPHWPHPARVRLSRRRRAANSRPAAADRLLLACLHYSRNLHVPQPRRARDEQQQLRRRIHGTHHPQIRIRRR